MKERLNLSYYLGFFILFFYQILCSIVYLLPPLIGVFFVYLIIHFNKKGFDKTSLFIILYFCFIELTHGLFLFCTTISFLIFYYYFYNKLIYKLKNRDILIILFIIFVYGFNLILNLAYSYIFEVGHLNYDIIFIYYICLESLLAIVLFRGVI